MKIFDLDYLEKEQLTDDDLYYLFECKTFNYSLIIGMFHYAGYKNYTNERIINMIRNDDKWVYKHFWKRKQHQQFEDKLVNIYRNVYWYSYDMSRIKAQNWMIMYGLSIRGNNIDK